MTYRQTSFEPTPAKGAVVRPYDRWQKLGLAAFGAGMVLVLLDVAGWFGLSTGRDYPGTLMLLTIAGFTLLGYRSRGGLLGDKSPEFRRMLGLGFAVPGFLLALLEVAG